MKIIKNYIYNTLYQIMVIIIPFITMPYLTRIFTPTQLGINSYTLSIVNYFSLIGVLGMTMYGNREIAYVRDDKLKLKETFWNLFITKAFTCSLSIIIYYLFVYISDLQYKTIYLIQGIYLFGALLDISWFYTGVEDFRKVVLRDSATKILGLICIFIFVRDSSDLNKYILILALSNFIGVIIMWMYIPKEFNKVHIDKKEIKRHIKPLISLFIPQVAIQVYSLLSRTMIGMLSNNEQVALYDYSQRIIQIVITVIGSMGVVIMPRIANIVTAGKDLEVKEIIKKSFNYITYIAMPMCFGLMAVARTFVGWFFGNEFREVGLLISITAVIIIAVSWANVIGVQYLIASNKEKKYTIAIVISAFVNIIANFLFIGNLGALGACIALILAEYTGTIIQILLVKNELPIWNMIYSVLKYLVVSIVMYVGVNFINKFSINGFLINIIQIIVGIILYTGMLYLIKDKIQSEILDKLFKLIKKK
ncbi:flippase [Clostridium perfringens]|uniref:flippase n=1 Tax=Clostridium perfringens TaxID=1502 RepID=UPI0024BCE59E|nr:flippase [Clostridium perfringens]